MKRLNNEQSLRLKITLKNAFLILLVGLVYLAFVKISGFGIPCVLNTFTGFYCPGCGISRMFMSLAAFDFKVAFGHNAFIMTVGPVAIVFIIRYYILYVLQGKQKIGKFETVLLVITFALMIIFTVLRNIPQFSFLAP